MRSFSPQGEAELACRGKLSAELFFNQLMRWDVADTSIRTDAVGRFCLNDLHRAAGGESKHQPAFFMRRKETGDLMVELTPSADSQRPAVTVNDGRNNGTYVAKELVYAYAMWISPAFHLKVIRAYDAMVSKPDVSPPALRICAACQPCRPPVALHR